MSPRLLLRLGATRRVRVRELALALLKVEAVVYSRLQLRRNLGGDLLDRLAKRGKSLLVGLQVRVSRPAPPRVLQVRDGVRRRVEADDGWTDRAGADVDDAVVDRHPGRALTHPSALKHYTALYIPLSLT